MRPSLSFLKRVRLLFLTALALVSSLSWFSCTSRLRLDLYLTADETRKRVSVDEADWVAGATLNEPTAPEKVLRGSQSVIVVDVSMRREAKDGPGAVGLLSYDENFRCRFYMELDTNAVESVPVTQNSLLQVLGRYDLDPEVKLYYPHDGQLRIDSITSRFLYANIRATFRNSLEEELELDGEFKVRRR